MPTPLPGVTPPGNADQGALLQQHLDAVTNMRRQGANWDEIHQFYQGQVNNMRANGAKDDEIRAYYGGQDPTGGAMAIQQRTQENVASAGATTRSPVDAFVDGLTGSSTAALMGVKPKAPGGGFFEQAGEVVGDLPAMSVGGAIGSFLAAPAIVGGGVAGAGVPGAGETGASEVAGGGLGAAAASGFGAMAAPQLIKSERDEWYRAHHDGWNAGDFVMQHGASVHAAVETVTQGGIGALTGGVGGFADRALARAGISGFTKTAAKLGAEGVTMTAAAAAVQGRMPTTEDIVDGAVLLAAFHTAGHVGPKAMAGFRERLWSNYRDTGQMPAEAAAQAKTDPVKRAELMGNPPPVDVPPGSSRTLAPSPHQAPPTPEQYVVPRVAGDFDTAVRFTLQHEGGARVIDANGAPVKWGINKADNPNIDVDHLGPQEAAEVYKRKYWDTIGADQLPPNMRLAAFDTAVVEGPARAKQWLAESGGDPQVLLGKRAAFEANLAAKDPAKYGRFVKAWGNRIRDLGGHDASVGLVSRDPLEPMSEAHQALIDNEGLPPEPPDSEKPPEPPPLHGEPGDDDGDHVARVMARTAPPEAGDWWGDTAHGAARIYGEMFNPDHPIRTLMSAVTEGGDLDGITRPEALRRLAENSGTLSKYAIEHNMTDMDNNIVGRGLKPIIEDAGDKATQRIFLDAYARSRWADGLHERGLETGIDPNDAKNTIRDLEAKHPKFPDLFKELQGWRNGTLQWLGDGGVHDPTKVSSLIEKGEEAMPGYRRMDDGTIKPNPSPGKGMWSPIRTATGSTRLIEPMEQSLMRDAFIRRSLADTNRSNAAIADAAIGGDKASERRSVNINVMSAIDDLRGQGIEDEDLPTALLKATGREVKDNEVPVLRDGKLSAVTFENPEVTRVLRGFDSGVRSTAVKVAAAVTSIPRTMQTIANPLFAPKMQVYDAWFQHITNPDARNVMKSFTLGLGAMVDKNSGMYDEWMRNGGAERVFTRMSNDQYLKDTFGLRGPEQPGLLDNGWNVGKSVMHGLDAWARTASTPIRLGRYIQGREAGEEPLRAAAASTESSLHRPNFGGPLSKTLNSVLPFLTARLNGMEKTGRAMLGGSLPLITGGRLDNTTSLGIPYSARKFWINGAVAITVPALLTWWTQKDEPWYKAMPDWQKDNAIAIIPPTAINGAIPIPAPPLLGPIFSGIPRRLMEAFAEDNPHAFDNLGPSLFAGLAGPTEFVSASILQPMVEHMTNFSFMKNQPLVNPDTVRGVGAAEQFNHYSSDVARGLARFTSDLSLVSGMKLSPPVIDNYIKYWGGDAGQMILKTINAVDNLGRVNKPPAQSFSDWPGVSSWQVRYPNASAQPTTDFYNRAAEFDSVHGSLKALMKDGDLAEFTKKANENPAGAAYHLLRFQDEPSDVDTTPYMDALVQASAKVDQPDMALYKEGSEAVKAASVYANKVWEDPKLTPLDKRQILDQAYAELQVISERTNEALDRAESGHAARSAPKAPDSIQFQSPDDRVQ